MVRLERIEGANPDFSSGGHGRTTFLNPPPSLTT